MKYILVANGGSSSLRLAVFTASAPMLQLVLRVKIDRIGQAGATLLVTGRVGETLGEIALAGSDFSDCIESALQQLAPRLALSDIVAVGHRIVHGMAHTEAMRVTDALMNELRSYVPIAPEHLPAELDIIAALQRRLPDVPELVCFDTAFHRGMPRVATLLTIPRKFQIAGVQRYGFHGLSYAYLMTELARLRDPAASSGRVILAHLGNGSSVAAVRDGRSIDTSMGMTPTGGLMMGTRTGDVDPGLLYHLSSRQGLTPADIHRLVNHASGLLGVSERSADVRELLAHVSSDARAAEAIALFTYQARKWIGAMAAALDGLDTLVFAGGIGENAPSVRAGICEGLGFLGIRLNGAANTAGEPVISIGESPVTVRVIHTDEELMIAREVSSHLL